MSKSSEKSQPQLPRVQSDFFQIQNPKDVSSTVIHDKEEQQILSFEKTEQANVSVIFNI